MMKAELIDLIEQYARRVGVYSALEATRIATDRRDRGESDSEARLKQEVVALRTLVKIAVNQLPIN